MFIIRVIMMAIRSLRANLLRSLLATLGVIIGVAAVIAANAVLVGAQASVQERVESLGSNLITIMPTMARRAGRPVGTFQTLKDSDVTTLLQESELIAAALPEVQRTGQIKYFSRNDQVMIVGTNESYADVFNLTIEEGRFINAADVGSGSKVVVLGHKVAQKLFGDTPAVGAHVKLGMARMSGFQVIGVLEKKGQKGFRDMDDQVIIPVTSAQRNIAGIRHIDMITVQASERTHLEAMQDDVKRTLRRLHRIRAGDEDDFRILNPQEIRENIGQMMQIWALVLYMISGISLVVGGIGIMNIMLVSVTERTREIGVRIAMGARGLDILQQFLIEAGTISLVGGGLGVLVGYAIADLMTQISNDMIITQTSTTAIVTALVVSVKVGIVSGLYPAIKAAQLDPVEALRYE